MNSIVDVKIPSFYDPEYSQVTLDITEPSPGFLSPVIRSIAGDKSKFTLSPTGFAEVGVHTLKITLSDD